jgi:hypothetical protein
VGDVSERNPENVGERATRGLDGEYLISVEIVVKLIATESDSEQESAQQSHAIRGEGFPRQ